MIKNVIALAISNVAVHLLYIGYIRPEAALIIEFAQANGQAAPRDLVVILKDFEQEVCLILMLWGVFLIGSKCFELLNERYLFKVDLLEGIKGDGTDIPATLKALEGLPEKVRDTPLIRTLTAVWSPRAT